MDSFLIEKNKKQKDLEHGIFEDCRRKSKKRKSVFLQYAAAVTACLSAAGLGCIISWTSPAIPHLISYKSEFPVTINQSAWIASLNSVGMIIGYLLIPLLMGFLNPKNTLLLLAVPQLTSCIFIIFARDYITLFIGRIIGGIGYGSGLCAASVYVGEIGDKNTRGSFLVLIKLGINSGVFFTLLIGAYLPYNQMNLALISLPVLFILTFSFMPHSSYFNRAEDSDEVEETGEEMNLMKIPDLLEPDLKTESEVNNQIFSIKNQSKNTFRSMINSWKKLLSTRSSIKALIIITLICSIEILSGYIVILTYTQQILTYSGFSLAPEKATLVLTAFKIVGSIACTQIIEKIERRYLILISGLMAASLQGIVGLFFFLKFCTMIDTNFFNWLPLVSITVYGTILTIGISSVYYVFQSELFSSDVKGAGMAFTNITYEILAFLVKLMFYQMIDGVGIHMTFWIFAIFGCCGTLIGFFIIPESKGKSFEEIQAMLNARQFCF